MIIFFPWEKQVSVAPKMFTDRLFSSSPTTTPLHWRSINPCITRARQTLYCNLLCACPLLIDNRWVCFFHIQFLFNLLFVCPTYITGNCYLLQKGKSEIYKKKKVKVHKNTKVYILTEGCLSFSLPSPICLFVTCL